MTLKEYFVENGIKQSWLAHKVGVSDSTMSGYVNGTITPSAMVIARIVKVTRNKVRPADLWPKED